MVVFGGPEPVGMLAVVPLFLEGAASVALVCTLPVLIASLVFLVASGRDALAAAAGYLLGLTLLGWLRFADLVAVSPDGATAVVGGVILTGSVVACVLAPPGRSKKYLVASASAVGGAVVASVWKPCVGREFANLLNNSTRSPLGALVSMAVYVSGIGLLTVSAALIPTIFPAVARTLDSKRASWVGAGLGTALGLLLALGLWADLAEELLVRSTA